MSVSRSGEVRRADHQPQGGPGRDHHHHRAQGRGARSTGSARRTCALAPGGFWKPGTKVSVAVNVFGKDLGDGVYGQKNVKSFRIGEQMLITADDHAKMVTFERDGKVIRRMPASMGKPGGTPTDNGIYIVGDKHARLVMDSSTYGVPVNSADGYRTPVDYATQDVLQRHLLPLRPVAGLGAGQHQHQSRLPQPEPRQRSVGHAEHVARRPGHGEVHPGSATVGHRRSRRLEHPVVGVEEGQRLARVDWISIADWGASTSSWGSP